MQVRKDKSETVSLYGTLEPLDRLGKIEASVNLVGKDATAEFIVICNEGRPTMGRKTAMASKTGTTS